MKKFLFLLPVLVLMLWLPVSGEEVWKTNEAGTVFNESLSGAPDTTDVYKVIGFNGRGSADNITELTVQYIVAHIDTNVVVALESSLDGSSWTNLNSDGNTTVTSNGSYMFEVTGVSTKRYFRFRSISQQGDSTTTIDTYWLFGG